MDKCELSIQIFNIYLLKKKSIKKQTEKSKTERKTVKLFYKSMK